MDDKPQDTPNSNEPEVSTPPSSGASVDTPVVAPVPSDVTKESTEGPKTVANDEPLLEAHTKTSQVHKKKILLSVIIIAMVLAGVVGAIFLLKPDKKQNQLVAPTQSAATDETEKKPEVPSDCLVQEDYSVLDSYSDEGDYGLGDDKVAYSDTVFFEPDSVEYTYETIMPEFFQGYTAFNERAKDKSFYIHLSGSVFGETDTAAGVKLANERAEKVKQGLVKAGIDTKKVKIGEPQKYDEGQQQDFNPEIFRNIDLRIIPTCSTDPKATNSDLGIRD